MCQAIGGAAPRKRAAQHDSSSMVSGVMISENMKRSNRRGYGVVTLAEANDNGENEI